MSVRILGPSGFILFSPDIAAIWFNNFNFLLLESDGDSDLDFRECAHGSVPASLRSLRERCDELRDVRRRLV